MQVQDIHITKSNSIKYICATLPAFIACCMQYRLIIEFLADGYGWIGILLSQIIAIPVGLTASYFLVFSIAAMEKDEVNRRLKLKLCDAEAEIERLKNEIVRQKALADASVAGKDMAISIALKEADNRINELSGQVAYLKSTLQQVDGGNTLPSNWQLCYVRLMELVTLGVIERNGERVSMSYAQKNLTKRDLNIEQDRNNGAARMIQVKELMQKGFSVNEKGLLRRHLYTKTAEGAFAPVILAA